MPYARNEETSLYFEVRGEGAETVVLIPGLGLPGAAWGAVADQLGRHFRLVVVDPRGSGASDKPDAPYTAELVSADLRAVLQTSETASAHVVGLSMGGMIAQDLAVRFPERVKSLVLLSTFGEPDAWFTRLFEARRQLIERVGIVEHFRIFLMFIFSPLAFRTIPETIDRVEQSFRERSPDTAAYLRQIDYCLGHSASGELAAIQSPTLVISGTHDFLIPSALAAELAGVIPGAEHTEFEGASHGLWLEFPERLAAVCEEFIKRSTSKGGKP